MKEEKENQVECCEWLHSHPDIVNKVQSSMPGEDTLYRLTGLFKVFGEPTRIKILYVLSQGETCVCDIAQILNMTQSAISHQLRILKENRLVKFRKEGKTVFYSLDDQHIFTILNQGLEHIEE